VKKKTRLADLLPVLAVAALLLGLGLAVRLYDQDDPPLDFHPTRQLHSLIMARGMYAQAVPGAYPAWQSERAVQQGQAEGLIEPPILESLAVFTYRLAGRELPWAARVYSSLFWLAGALGFYGLCRLYLSRSAALVGMGFMLVLPYGIYASRAFQPDPLMTALIVLSWWAFARWMNGETPPLRNWIWAILAGLLGGAALLVKGTALFFVAGGWAGLVLAGSPLTNPAVPGGLKGLRAVLRRRQVWIIALLVVLPYGLYTAWGALVSGTFAGQLSLRFFPQYWVDPVFYLRWYNLVESAFSLPWLALGLLGAFFLPRGAARGLGWGAWIGYLAMGFALSHHISTHDYYSLPLIPLMGFGLAALTEAARQTLPEPRRLTGALAVILLLSAAGLSTWEARTVLKRADYRAAPAFWQNLADRMGRDAGVVGITQDYGARLVYYGWITPNNWLTAAEFDLRRAAGQQFDLGALFAEQTQGKQFFLVTVPEEFDRQPELKALLNARYAVFDQGPGYLIYDLRKPLQGVN
jgi:hypothetical protein